MKINIYSIEKSVKDDFEVLVTKYIKMASNYAEISSICLFDKNIAKAQNIGQKEAMSSYTQAYLPYMKGYNIVLDPDANELDSFEFSKIFDENMQINFFIGGAYGFEQKFISLAQKNISLSRLTYAHKVAKIVLVEQIYRGLCIKNKHPYHK